MPLYPAPQRSYVATATDHGYLAWSMDPANTVASTANISGTLYGTRVEIPTTIRVTNVSVYVATAGATLTAGQNLLGLYTSAGVKIAETADQTTAWGTNGAKVAAFTGGPFTVVGGPKSFVYVAFLSVGTTPPTFRGSNVTALALNINLPAGLGARSTSQATQTTIPATFAPTIVAQFAQWCALS